MNEFKELQKDLPQLIVALDSLDDTANYIHIKDVKEDTLYYCPCCKGVIKPRAYKDDKEYQVQAHFYHDNGGCNEETFIHYICKMWLFESGCEFKVDNQIYTVSKIETEKTFHTKFGDYRPDITVYTEENKTFFFEIKNTNKKTENYIPKWDELENDVVEVDVRYFINQKVDSNIPEFKLIYSDGECFINTYTRKDYEETIALRKLEWKRQDKINYKIMWEKLDWFWIELQKYKNGVSNNDDILKYFSSLSFYDIGDCYGIVSKMNCLRDIKDKFRYITNTIIVEYIDNQISYLMQGKGINNYKNSFNVRKNLSTEWFIGDLYDNEKKYSFVFIKEYKKWVLSPEFAVSYIDGLSIKVDESISDSNKSSEQTKVDSMIKNSIKTNKSNISIKEKYKIEIDKLSKDIADKRWCKLISNFIYKKTNVKFNVYVNNDYIFIESDFIKIKYGTFNDWDFTPKCIKDKCNEIIYAIKNIDFNKTTYCQFDFYDYKNLTSTIKDSKLINASTISVNKVLVANKILNDDKNSFTDEYEWMVKNKICKEFYNRYYSYTSLLWNRIGGIWIDQNWEHLNEQYKKINIAYKKTLRYFNSLIKEYPTVKIVKSDIWSDCYVLNLDLTGQGGDCVRFVEIFSDTYDFKIGHDYEDNILNFDYKKAKESMKRFLKWYLYEKEREDIRLFNVQKEECECQNN